MLGNLLLHSLHLLDRLLWQLMIAQNLLLGLLARFRVLCRGRLVLHLLVLLELFVVVCVHLDLYVGQVFIRLP